MGLTIHYQKEKKGLKLIRCYGNDAFVTLPDQVDGQPFKVLGDYAFSEWKKQEEEDVQIYETDDDTLFAHKKRTSLWKQDRKRPASKSNGGIREVCVLWM